MPSNQLSHPPDYRAGTKSEYRRTISSRLAAADSYDLAFAVVSIWPIVGLYLDGCWVWSPAESSGCGAHRHI